MELESQKKMGKVDNVSSWFQISCPFWYIAFLENWVHPSRIASMKLIRHYTAKSVQGVTGATGMASSSQQSVNIWSVIWTFQFFAIWNSRYNFRFWGRMQKLLRHWSNSSSQTLTLRPQNGLEVVCFTFDACIWVRPSDHALLFSHLRLEGVQGPGRKPQQLAGRRHCWHCPLLLLLPLAR